LAVESFEDQNSPLPGIERAERYCAFISSHLISDHIIRRHPSKNAAKENDTNMDVAEENLNVVMTDKHKQGPTFLKLQEHNSQLSAQMQHLN